MDRTADTFVVSSPRWQQESLMHVLSLRKAEVRRRDHATWLWGQPQWGPQRWWQRQNEEAVILNKGACARVERTLFWEWWRKPQTQKLREEVWERAEHLAGERRRLGERTSQGDLYQRSMRSYWKTTVFNHYGGEIWLFTLIATGRVHAVSVKIVNEIIAARIREEAKREPVSDPVQAQPLTIARASSQGQVKGVQHQKIPAGRLRDEARHADKQWEWHDKKWWKAAERRMSKADADWWRWKSAWLQEEADRRWAEATEESIKAGHPFKDRDGTTVTPGQGPPRQGTFERSLHILLKRIEAGEVTWPPAP